MTFQHLKTIDKFQEEEKVRLSDLDMIFLCV